MSGVAAGSVMSVADGTGCDVQDVSPHITHCLTLLLEAEDGAGGVDASVMRAPHAQRLAGHVPVATLVFPEGEGPTLTDRCLVLKPRNWVPVDQLGDSDVVFGSMTVVRRDACTVEDYVMKLEHLNKELHSNHPKGFHDQLRFRRLGGAVLSDGTISQSHGRTYGTLYLNHPYDVAVAQRDIEALTGSPWDGVRHSTERKSAFGNNFELRLPAALARDIAAATGQNGRKTDKAPALFPPALEGAGVPRAHRDEHLSGIYGGDGCATVYVRPADNFTEIRYTFSAKKVFKSDAERMFNDHMLPWLTERGLTASLKVAREYSTKDGTLMLEFSVTHTIPEIPDFSNTLHFAYDASKQLRQTMAELYRRYWEFAADIYRNFLRSALRAYAGGGVTQPQAILQARNEYETRYPWMKASLPCSRTYLSELKSGRRDVEHAGEKRRIPPLAEWLEKNGTSDFFLVEGRGERKIAYGLKRGDGGRITLPFFPRRLAAVRRSGARGAGRARLAQAFKLFNENFNIFLIDNVLVAFV
ncbi:hypothetical protein DFJ74DRAFT_683397 [Hyaloraphidium curvatum]|nr:hypothetical protein DFJ74DRAFT_683397 [Hyaloraphidium curvatum]